MRLEGREKSEGEKREVVMQCNLWPHLPIMHVLKALYSPVPFCVVVWCGVGGRQGSGHKSARCLSFSDCMEWIQIQD